MLTHLERVAQPADAVEVGRIGEAWGIKGWFKVLAHSAFPEAIFSSKRWFVVPGAPGQAGAGPALLLRISEVKEHAGGWVACAHDIGDRNGAEALRGARVFVPRSSFPSTAVDEYYWVDLIGLEVQNREGQILGIVRELLATAAQAVLVIDHTEDGKAMERMIPFVAAYVDRVDLPGKRIHVDWQPDY